MGGILPLGVIINKDNPKPFEFCNTKYLDSDGIDRLNQIYSEVVTAYYSVFPELLVQSKVEYPILSMVGYDTETGVLKDIGADNKYIDLSQFRVVAGSVNGEEVSVQAYVYGKRIPEDIFFAIYDKDLNLYYSSKQYLAVYTEFKCAFVFDSKTKEMKLYHEDIEDAIPDIDSNITIGNIWTGTEQWKAITDKKDTGLYAFNDTLLITSDFKSKEYVIPKEYKNIYIHPYSALESIVLHKDIEILVGHLNHGTTGNTRIKKVFMSRESSEKLLCHVIHLLLYRQVGLIAGRLGSMYKKEEYVEYLAYCRENNELLIQDKLKDVEITVY